MTVSYRAILASTLLIICRAQTTTAPPGCLHNGTWYHVGQSFKTSPCIHCYCTSSKDTACAITDCTMPPCVDAVRDPAQCCPVCPNGRNCRHTDGTIIKQGEVYHPDPDTTCRCPTNTFGLHGSLALCAVVNRRRSSAAVPLGCMYNGHLYPLGRTFSPSQCQQCYCTPSGEVLRYALDCLPPPCVDSVIDPTECCPVCPNGENCRHTDGTVIKKGAIYQPNSYTRCQCRASTFGFPETTAICAIEETQIVH